MRIRFTAHNHNAVKMMKRRDMIIIRRNHMERANTIRESAKIAASNFYGLVPQSEIDSMIKDAEFQAIAIENCKCMETH